MTTHLPPRILAGQGTRSEQEHRALINKAFGSHDAQPTTLPAANPCAVYWVYGAQNKLLYIGSSLSILARLNSHRYKSDWYPEIRKILVKWHDSKAEAILAEYNDIRKYKPVYNINGTNKKLNPR